MMSQLLHQDVSSLKFSALKVDVTSVAAGARRQPIIVVVVSHVTRSRDVVRMVVQKLGMDPQDVALMQLAATVSYKSHCRTSSDHNGGGCEEIVMLDDESPMSIYSEHPKHCVRFQLQRKRKDAVNGADNDDPLPWRHNGNPLPRKPGERQAQYQYEPCTGSPQPQAVWNGHDERPRPVQISRYPGAFCDPRPLGLCGDPPKLSDFEDIRTNGLPRRPTSGSDMVLHRMVDQSDPQAFLVQSAVRNMQKPDPHPQRCSSDRVDRTIHHRSAELYRPFFNLSAWPDISSKDWIQPVRSNSASLGSTTGDSITERPLLKFFSLPDISRDAENGDYARQAWSTEVAPLLKCMDRLSTFISMPCISSHELQRRYRAGCGRGLTPRRLLPTLSISEEAVEAKRKSMSALLSERLKKTSEQHNSRRHRKKSRTLKSHQHNGSKHDVSTTPKNQAQHRRRITASGVDDDCISVTSREVAAILSTAGPLAPPSDDDYDENHYDDVGEPEIEPHNMRLLRISSSCSSGSSTAANNNNSTGTSFDLATPPRSVDNAPYESLPVRLNNGNSGCSSSGAEPFRPKVNGYRDVSPVRNETLLEVGQGRDLTLFDLVRSHSLVVVTLELRLNNGHHIRAAPFQVINDVIYIPAENSAISSSRRRTRLKVSLPVVATVPTINRTDWVVTSSDYVSRGDIIVEVNGSNVVSQSAATILDLVLGSSSLDLVLARPHSTPH